MGKIRKTLSIVLHKIFNVPYRTVITPHEIENILSCEPVFYIAIDKNGVLGIKPKDVDGPRTRAASTSLAYFLTRELYDFDLEIQRRLDKLKRMNVSRPTTHLDALLLDDEPTSEGESKNGEESKKKRGNN